VSGRAVRGLIWISRRAAGYTGARDHGELVGGFQLRAADNRTVLRQTWTCDAARLTHVNRATSAGSRVTHTARGSHADV